MKQRLAASSRAAGLHLLCGCIVLLVVALWVFFVWFPYPYYKISNGGELFLIFLVVDVVCGPLLTLILFDPGKSRLKWRIDIALILFIQLGAMGYGINNIATSRPVFLAFEGNRFRVVCAADVDVRSLSLAPPGLAQLSFFGPRLLGVKLLNPGDRGFIESMIQAIDGNHPAFRPERWVEYVSQKDEVRSALLPMQRLLKNHEAASLVRDIEQKMHLTGSELGYLPMVQDKVTNWVVVIERKSAMPIAFWNIDGWVSQ